MTEVLHHLFSSHQRDLNFVCPPLAPTIDNEIYNFLFCFVLFRKVLSKWVKVCGEKEREKKKRN